MASTEMRRMTGPLQGHETETPSQDERNDIMLLHE